MSVAVVAKTFWSSLKHSFLHLAYPAKCLHCSISLSPTSPFLCEACGALLEGLDPREHCPVCFNPLGEENSLICEACFHDPSSYVHRAAVFPYEGVAATLVKRLKEGNQPYLAKGMAAYLYLQWDRLGWPTPDGIILKPLSFLKRLERGYNQSALLAEELGKLLQCPVWHAIKPCSGDSPHVSLPQGKRFQLKARYSLVNKKVLVIDDVITSDLTLEHCAEALKEGSPSALYALTFCKTLKI